MWTTPWSPTPCSPQWEWQRGVTLRGVIPSMVFLRNFVFLTPWCERHLGVWLHAVHSGNANEESHSAVSFPQWSFWDILSSWLRGVIHNVKFPKNGISRRNQNQILTKVFIAHALFQLNLHYLFAVNKSLLIFLLCTLYTLYIEYSKAYFIYSCRSLCYNILPSPTAWYGPKYI